MSKWTVGTEVYYTSRYDHGFAKAKLLKISRVAPSGKWVWIVHPVSNSEMKFSVSKYGSDHAVEVGGTASYSAYLYLKSEKRDSQYAEACAADALRHRQNELRAKMRDFDVRCFSTVELEAMELLFQMYEDRSKREQAEYEAKLQAEGKIY